jgi:hypothetical protein
LQLSGFGENNIGIKVELVVKMSILEGKSAIFRCGGNNEITWN